MEELEQVAEDLSVITHRPFEIKLWGNELVNARTGYPTSASMANSDVGLSVVTVTGKEYFTYCDFLDNVDKQGNLRGLPLSLNNAGGIARIRACALRRTMLQETDLLKITEQDEILNIIKYGHSAIETEEPGLQKTVECSSEIDKAVGVVGIRVEDLTWRLRQKIANIATQSKYDPQKQNCTVDYSFWDDPFSQEQIDRIPAYYEQWVLARDSLGLNINGGYFSNGR